MGNVCKLLLIEDQNEDAELIEKALSNHCRLKLVWHARNKDEAIAYLAGRGGYADREKYGFPGVVVLDSALPPGDGLEILQWLHGRTPRPKVGVFTVSNDALELERVYQLADLVQAKPLDIEKLERFLHFLENMAFQSQDRPAAEPRRRVA
jgi:CheY-like chemotaxis protein